MVKQRSDRDRDRVNELKGILSQHLSEDRIRELEKTWDRPVGDRFASNVEAPDLSGQYSCWTPWLQAFHGLKEFRRIHGHCNVTQTDTVHRKLGKWVQRQRSKYRHNEMPLDEIHKLESIGFEWTPKRGPRRRKASSIRRTAASLAPESIEEKKNEKQEDANRSSPPVVAVPLMEESSEACSVVEEQPVLPRCELDWVARALLDLRSSKAQSPALCAKECMGQIQQFDDLYRASQEATRIFGCLDAKRRQEHLYHVSGFDMRVEGLQRKSPGFCQNQGSMVPNATSSQFQAMQSRRNLERSSLYNCRLEELQRLWEGHSMATRVFVANENERDVKMLVDPPETDCSTQYSNRSSAEGRTFCSSNSSIPRDVLHNSDTEEAAAAASDLGATTRDQILCHPKTTGTLRKESLSSTTLFDAATADMAAAAAAVDVARRMILGE